MKPHFSLILISTLLMALSGSSLGIVIPYGYRNPQPFKNTVESPAEFTSESIQVIDGKFVLAQQLQDELSVEIIRAKAELENLANNFSIQFNENIGIVYFHKGHDDWSVKFTFGGLILKTSQEIILSSDRIFALKAYFAKTKLIVIKEKQYQTTGQMRQLGPILHEEKPRN
jgi:hypothetical protein